MRAVLAIPLFGFVAACGPTVKGGDGEADAMLPPWCQEIGCQNYCPTGTRTTISGRVTAPNGIDPVPGALVYLPKTVAEFPSDVACEVCDQIISDALVIATTEADGTFTLGPIPTAPNQTSPFEVQVISQKGRFRRVVDVTIELPCTDNDIAPSFFRLPGRNDPSSADRIPKIAVATGDYDIMECVLLKLGIEQGQFDLYEGALLETGGGSSGDFDELFTNLDRLLGYNIVFINCTHNTWEIYLQNSTVRANIESYVASGGRLYVTDWSYDWIEQIPAWSSQIDFAPGPSGATPEPTDDAAIGDDGITTEALVKDPGLIEWLRAVEDVTGENIIGADNRVHIEHFLNAWVMQYLVPENEETNTTVWLEGQVSGDGLSGNLPLTTTFDYQECGRVLYSSYHTHGRDLLSSGGSFPSYCPVGEPLSPQERVLEYLILHIADCLPGD